MEEANGSEESRTEDVPPMASTSRPKRKITKPQLGYDPQKGMWSEEEKKRLLGALKKHGCLNIAALQKEVQTKSEESIKLFITNYSKRGRYLFEKQLQKEGKKKESSEGCCEHHKTKLGISDEPIDQWLQLLQAAQPPGYNELTTLPIARAILFISKYEEHPDPKDCGGVDFKGLYENLYYMLCGVPGKEMNKATKDFFEKSIDELLKLVRTPEMLSRADVLRDVSRIHYPPSGRVRKYPGKKQMELHERDDFLLELQGYNPLNLPRGYLDFHAEKLPAESNPDM